MDAYTQKGKVNAFRRMEVEVGSLFVSTKSTALRDRSLASVCGSAVSPVAEVMTPPIGDDDVCLLFTTNYGYFATLVEILSYYISFLRG